MEFKKEGKDWVQHSAICHQMWEDRNKSKKGETMDEEQKKFIQEGKVHATSFHSYPEVEPEEYEKPKSYVEILEAEVRGDVPDRAHPHIKY